MMTLPMESSLVEAPMIATAFGRNSASSILFPLLDLLDEGLDVGLGLLVGHAAQVVEVPGDHQAGTPADPFQPLGKAVAAVRVVGAGLGVVVEDPVDPELLQHPLEVLVLVHVGPDEEKLR